ncbi:hypothetical protein ACHAXT_002879 [Thalassiosira profunda]
MPPRSSPTADANEWEQKATHILAAIRCFVDALRSAPCLKLNALHPTRPTPENEGNQCGDFNDASSLYAHLDSLGVVQQVEELGHQSGASSSSAAETSTIHEPESVEALLQNQYDTDERRQMLHRIVLPLLRHLGECYDILDSIPQTHHEQPETTSTTQSNASRSRRKNKAPPPLGMLSLNDYTNVACLLEFAMFTSLVPCLEYPDVCLPALPPGRTFDLTQVPIRKILNPSTVMSQKRNQMLPKSLAGRVSKVALTWGTASDSAVRRRLEALVVSEKEAEKENSQQMCLLQKALLVTPLALPPWCMSPEDTIPSPSQRAVDCREAALAYRGLLGGGASGNVAGSSNPSIPLWLRLRLGQCLTKLAGEDLQSVVEVFVASARGPGGGEQSDSGSAIDDAMTSAAARLARALCAKPTSAPESSSSNSSFYERMCSQFTDFLFAQGDRLLQDFTSKEGGEMDQSRPSMAMHLTLWATLAQLPEEIRQSFFTAKLAAGLMPPEGKSPNSSAIQSTAAIAAWLLTIPSSLDALTERIIHSFLFTPLSDDRSTIFGQVLRLAASYSRKESPGESSLVVEVAANDAKATAAKLSQIALAHMIHVIARMEGSKDALPLLKAVSASGIGASETVDLPTLVEGVQDRAKCLVGAIASLSQLADDAKESNAPLQSLTSNLFQLALLVHFTTLSAEGGGAIETELDGMDLNCLSESDRDELKMAATALLGELCENCPPSSLLASGDSGVLKMLGLVVNSAAALLQEDQTTNTASEDSEELVSTAAIALSLLVALLELGEERRSTADEAFFRSLLSPLRVLSSSESLQSADQSSAVPELAEMASHAMALIAARGETPSSNNAASASSASKKTRMEAIVETLAEAESDLQSTQPPLRAKGVVSLRHVARSLTDGEGSAQSEKRGMVTELHGSTKTPALDPSTREGLALVSRTLARICLNALSDSESYVYLASIQTLVAVSDVCPSEIMPLMGVAVAKGGLNVEVATADLLTTPVQVSLSQEQRIKATEALLFMIRRRGDGIFLYGPPLLETMLFGSEHSSDAHDEGDAPLSIQSQTHSFFMGDTDEESVNDDNHAKEKEMRLNTGGPVFLVEENEVLRAGAVSLVSELVSALNPSVIAAHCHTLVGLATDALQLEASRPVRRAAASLAREIYECTMREVTAEVGSKTDCKSTMAIALAGAKEERLHNALSRCVSADDVAVEGKTRLVDPATQARCAEALGTRQELADMGVLQAAAIIAQSIEQEEKDSRVQAVRRALS